MKNVYNDPNYVTQVAELKKELIALRIKYKDSQELDEKYIDIYKKRSE